MPTSRNSSIALARAALAFMPSWTMNTSPIWRPILKTGLSEVMGSWKIMEIRRPRMARISASPRVSRSLPSNRMRPSTIRPGGVAISRMMESEATDLPQPDSPTRQSVRPLSTENDTPLTARTIPFWVKK